MNDKSNIYNLIPGNTTLKIAYIFLILGMYHTLQLGVICIFSCVVGMLMFLSPLPHSYADALSPFGDRAFKKVINVE